MKLIHCADLHLDSAMTANLTREQAKARKIEILRTFVRMVDYAQDHDVRAVLIAGDLFDTRNVSATVRNQVRDTIVSHPDIDFLYLKGNHDNDNFLARLDEIPQNLLLFDSEWTSYVYGKTVISGLELTKDNAHTAANTLLLDAEKFNIVMMHGQLNGYDQKNDALSISLSELKNRHIDYLALGHVHEYSFGQLDARGYYAYPGCLEGRGFDECDEHGFILIDVDEENRRASYDFIPIAFRTVYAIPVDVSGVLTTQEAARRMEITMEKGDYAATSLVKFVLTGEVDVECELNEAFLRDQFAPYFYYVKVENKTSYRIDYTEYEKDASLKGEFIRMVLASDENTEQKTEIIRCGIGALAGEEV